DILAKDQLSLDVVLSAGAAGWLRCVGATQYLTNVSVRGPLRLVLDVEYGVEKNGSIIEEPIAGLELPGAELITLIGRFLRVNVKRADQLIREGVFELDLLGAVARQAPYAAREIIVHVDLDLAGRLCVLAVENEVRLIAGMRVAHAERGKQGYPCHDSYSAPRDPLAHLRIPCSEKACHLSHSNQAIHRVRDLLFAQ